MSYKLNAWYMPSQLAFLLTSVFGAVICLSSSHWLGVWAGLEVNLFGFIPFMSGDRRTGEMESTIKYFLAQEVGSGLLMMSVVFMLAVCGSGQIGTQGGCFTGLGLLLKTGIAPFHFWVPGAMAEISWVSCFLLSTLQKVGPLFSMFFFGNTHFLVVVGAVSVVVGSVGGVFQTRLRPLLGYSSIAHMGWCLGCFGSVGSAYYYFGGYVLTLVGVFALLSEVGVYGMETTMSGGSWILLSLAVLSLAGFPPFALFFAKVQALISIWSHAPFVVVFFLFGGAVSFFYYFNLAFTFALKGVMSTTQLSTKASFLLLVFLPLAGPLLVV
uniref:NADH-ubiquinone oxidoreductase chain 2 n=1 Tax=Lyonsia norwegica TaxID=228471 RepID=A0A1U9XPH1_LYONO|nr:NADH dehydrogenase subunit 2 [Lyonsia norwegica]AQZ26146.1 NADH dehydrogenase subunit 2 [Lyonsia norwegica]